MRSDSDELEETFGTKISHSSNHTTTEAQPLALGMELNPADLELSPPASQESTSSPTRTIASLSSPTRPQTEQPAFRMLRSDGGYQDFASARTPNRQALRSGKGVPRLDSTQTGEPMQESQKLVPGHAWLNARAQEEYVAAMEKVLDPNWPSCDFPDFFDERDMIINQESMMNLKR